VKTLNIANLDNLLGDSQCVDSDSGTFTPLDDKLVKLPRFFRWPIPYRLAIMSQPKQEQDIQTLSPLNLTLIITLTNGSKCSNQSSHNYRRSSFKDHLVLHLDSRSSKPEGENRLHCTRIIQYCRQRPCSKDWSSRK